MDFQQYSRQNYTLAVVLISQMLHSTAFHSYKNLSILQNKLFQQYWYVEIERIQKY